jgi:TatD DNase family protein
MYIDTHCHIDMFDNPIAMAQAYEKSQTICVMTTMLPSHYMMALSHTEPFKTIHPALGLHPLRAKEGHSEVSIFLEIVKSTDFIGEIGLDLSTEGKKNKILQIDILRRILPAIGKGKFLTVHSRNAHSELAMLIDEYRTGPDCFHYFTGGPKAAAELSKMGHYFSINHRMLKSRHRSILDYVPKEKILIESDGPFLTKSPISVVENIYKELGNIWQIDQNEIKSLIALNFKGCRTIGL